jgi:hypothetical protein
MSRHPPAAGVLSLSLSLCPQRARPPSVPKTRIEPRHRRTHTTTQLAWEMDNPAQEADRRASVGSALIVSVGQSGLAGILALVQRAAASIVPWFSMRVEEAAFDAAVACGWCAWRMRHLAAGWRC